MLLFLCYLLPWMLAKIDDATKFELTPEMQAELKELMKKVRELPCVVVLARSRPVARERVLGGSANPGPRILPVRAEGTRRVYIEVYADEPTHGPSEETR